MELSGFLHSQKYKHIKQKVKAFVSSNQQGLKVEKEVQTLDTSGFISVKENNQTQKASGNTRHALYNIQNYINKSYKLGHKCSSRNYFRY